MVRSFDRWQNSHPAKFTPSVSIQAWSWWELSRRALDVVVVDGALKLEVFTAVGQRLVVAVVGHPLIAVHRCSCPGVTGHRHWRQILVVTADWRRWTVVRSSQLVSCVVAVKDVVIVGRMIDRWGGQTESGGALRRHQCVQWRHITTTTAQTDRQTNKRTCVRYNLTWGGLLRSSIIKVEDNQI